MDTPQKPDFLRPCARIWLALLLLTGSTYAIGEAGLGGATTMLIVLGTAAVKVQLVAGHFMGLRHTRWLWRGIVLGWLIVVMLLITGAYLSTM